MSLDLSFQQSGEQSREGQQFAETGYSSGIYQGDRVAVETSLEQEPLPHWASQWQQNFMPSSNIQELRIFSLDADSAAAARSVRVQNEERSWEKLYAFVLLCDDDDDQTKTDASDLVLVSPLVGMLAPRGTASPKKDGFSDSIELQVSARIVVDDASTAGKLWLLVGTEAEKWVFKLV
ncbi:MAG: hypothetical protein SGARI_002816 [Bacillariaceae sp.]